MDRDQMLGQIVAYAEQHGTGPDWLRHFVNDVTGSQVEPVYCADELLAQLTPSQVEVVHEVIATHESWGSRRAS
jgi:hypothetical protein